jgi:hypothetical protein
MKYSAPATWLRPGDPGYEENKQFPWSKIGRLAGIPQDPHIAVMGFYLVDFRQDPPMVYFSNCSFQATAEVHPCLNVMPEPWRAPAQAYEYLKKHLHLSPQEEEACLHRRGRVRICAMVPDPGIGAPKPDSLIMDKKAFNSW